MIDATALVGLPLDVIDHLEQYCSSTICRARLARVIEDAAAGPDEAVAPRELVRLLDGVPGFWAPFDIAAADAYARLAVRPGSRLDSSDILLAAQAISRGLSLVTREPHLYAGISGLEALDPDAEADDR